MTTQFEGQVAVVTGAASGIGRATANQLAAHGCAVAVVDRSIVDGAEAVDEITKAGGNAVFVETDLSSSVEAADVINRTIQTLGRIDILVNAAGVNTNASLLDTTLDDWEFEYAVNIRAPFQLMQVAAKHMIDQGSGGKIVSVSSSSAFRARFITPAYASSKIALVGLTRAAAEELGRHDINVNVVAPGLTATPMSTRILPGGRATLDELVSGEGPISNLLGRVSEPEDVANVIVFLVSDASRQLTGQVLHTSAGSVV